MTTAARSDVTMSNCHSDADAEKMEQVTVRVRDEWNSFPVATSSAPLWVVSVNQTYRAVGELFSIRLGR